MRVLGYSGLLVLVSGLVVCTPASGYSRKVVSNCSELKCALSGFYDDVDSDSSMEVMLKSGIYAIPDGLDFTGCCTNTSLILKAEERHGARFVGGHVIPSSSFKSVAGDAKECRIPLAARKSVVVADVGDYLVGVVPGFPDAFVGRYPPPVLFVNEQFMTLARWPNEGWATFSVPVERGERISGSKDWYSGGAFVFPEAQDRNWSFDAGVWLNGYWTHDWYNNSVRAVSFGACRGTNCVMRLRGNYYAGVMGEKTWGLASRRFYAFNVLEELDAPGEWWLDRETKRLYIYPPKRCFSREDVIVLANSDKPIIRGNGVRSITLDGLSFTCNYGNLISFRNSTGVHLLNCLVKGTAGDGVVLDGSSNLLNRCEMSMCGGRGVALSGGDRLTLRRSDSAVENCRIHGFGVFQRTYAPGCDVRGVGMRVVGNEIFNAPHSAVIYGGNEHLFENNDVHHVLLETGDSGAFYTGRDWTSQGNVIRGNFIHELGGVNGVTSTMGIYFDDCDCGDDVFGNVIWKVSRGVMIGGGREHEIRGNIFAECGVGVSIDCRGLLWKQWNSRENGGPSWMLEEKAKAVDYQGSIWSNRYPRLAQIMSDSPREPLYNSIESNAFVNCRWKAIYLEGERMREQARNIRFTGNCVVDTRKEPDGNLLDAEVRGGFSLTNVMDFSRFRLSPVGRKAAKKLR